MDGAERLGYEVRVYARVPDLDEGPDRAIPREAASKSKRSGGAISSSTGTGSADSDPGPVVPPPENANGHSRSSSLNAATRGGPTAYPRAPGGRSGRMAAGSGSAGRIRYREQGVDELLQLKLHQALADADSPPPPGSTIVLATGDGNAGQFNADGFLGAVRTALRKGWRVELYAWEYGLSKAWVKEFGGAGSTTSVNGATGNGRTDVEAQLDGPYGDRFRIVGLEKFAQDLLEIP